MIIRPVLPKDIEEIKQMDISYTTDCVWQMERKEVGEEVSTTFRSIRLPRSVKVESEWDRDWPDDWQKSDLFLVVEEDGLLVAYLNLRVDRSQNVGRITHLAVSRKRRRQGYAKALIQEARRWSKVRRVRAFVAETETKNYPAISFLKREGFSFCGFNDSFYQNRDIAVFFICGLV